MSFFEPKKYFVYFKIWKADKTSGWVVVYIKKGIRTKQQLLRLSRHDWTISRMDDGLKLDSYYPINEYAQYIFDIHLYETLDEVLAQHFADLI